MMKFLILLVTIFLSQVDIMAQSIVGGSLPSETSLSIGSLNMDDFRTYSLNYDDIKGSPYLEKDFLKGYFVLLDKKKTETLSLQYDIYRRDFFILNEDGKEIVIDKKFIRSVIMTGENETYQFKRINPLQALKLYDALYESEGLKIYADLEVNLKEGKNNGITKIEPKFSRTDKYYVLQKGASPKRIKLKKKDIFKFFSLEDQMKMDEVIEQQKLKLKGASSFKQLFDALDKS